MVVRPLVLLLGLLAVVAAPVRAETVRLEDLGVTLSAPPDFAPAATGGAAWERPGVARLALRVSEDDWRGLVAVLRAEDAAASGRLLEAAEDVKVPAGPAVLFEFSRPGGPGEPREYVLVAGGEGRAIVAEASWSPGADPDLRAALRKSLLSLERIPAGQQRVAGTQVLLVPPPGFAPAEAFSGFQDPARGASIMVAEIPGPYRVVARDMTDDRLLAGGMTVRSREPANLAGLPGVLLTVAQTREGVEYRKWLLLFGDGKGTVLVTGVCPAEHESALGKPLREALLSARLLDAAPDLRADLPFVLTPMPPLRFARTLGKAALYTKGGAFPVADPGDPLFVVAPSLVAMPVADRLGAARAAVQKTAEAKDVRILSSAEVTIDGLFGVEITAAAADARSGEPLALYQVMLFGEQGYYRMLGMVRERDKAATLPLFTKTARTFRRK